MNSTNKALSTRVIAPRGKLAESVCVDLLEQGGCSSDQVSVIATAGCAPMVGAFSVVTLDFISERKPGPSPQLALGMKGHCWPDFCLRTSYFSPASHSVLGSSASTWTKLCRLKLTTCVSKSPSLGLWYSAKDSCLQLRLARTPASLPSKKGRARKKTLSFLISTNPATIDTLPPLCGSFVCESSTRQILTRASHSYLHSDIPTRSCLPIGCATASNC